MALLVGIDEAGYGPLLGPLVVSSVTFELPDTDCDLWSLLQDACTRNVRQRDRRLVVADSKKVYRGGAGFSVLERTVLVTLALLGKRVANWSDLLDQVAPQVQSSLPEYQWYADQNVVLPLSQGVGDIPTRTNALKRACASCGVTLVDVCCKPMLEREYNHMVSSTRNKAVVLLGLVMKLVDRALKKRPGDQITIMVDRLGGRTHYRDALMTAFPDYDLEIKAETDSRSAYRLASTMHLCDIEFVTSGDDKKFPIALASMFSKYLRELFMHAFNSYWSGKLDGVKPTAGYYNDAQRWLTDAQPTISRLGIARDMLVRSR